MKDHIFFYGSARYSRQKKWDRVNKVGTVLPDELRTGPEFYGKLTATPRTTHQLSVSLRERPSSVQYAGLDSNFAPSVATITDNGSRIGTAEWVHFMASRSFSVRYLNMKETNEDVPTTELGYLPPFNPNNLAAMGQYTDPSQANLIVGGNQYSNIQNYRRHEVRRTFSQFFDLGKTSHALKAGIGYELGEEFLNRLANGWGQIVNITQSGVPALRTRYYTTQPPQLGQGSTYSLFVQDGVTIAKRTSVSGGILLN